MYRHEVVNINVNSKPNWYLELNPDGTIPLLQYKCHLIGESLVCMEFLHEEFGKYSCLSSRPLVRAHQRNLMMKFSRVTLAFSNFLNSKNESEKKKCHQQIIDNLGIYEIELYEPFFSGEDQYKISIKCNFHLMLRRQQAKSGGLRIVAVV